MTKNRISVIIPAKNSADSIARALNSVLRQTLPADEIIVIDDASSDATFETASALPGVRAYRVEYSNRAQARNYGVTVSSGEWIAFLDADDEWHPDKLREQLAFAVSTNASLCFHDFKLIKAGGQQISSWASVARGDAWCGQRRTTPALPCTSRDILGQGDVLFTLTALIRRQTWEDIGGMRKEFLRCQDIDAWLRVYESGGAITFLPSVLATKHGHGNIANSTTYWYRLQVIQASALRGVYRAPDKAHGDVLREAYSRELRSFAGWARRNGKLSLSARLYANWAAYILWQSQLKALSIIVPQP